MMEKFKIIWSCFWAHPLRMSVFCLIGLFAFVSSFTFNNNNQLKKLNKNNMNDDQALAMKALLDNTFYIKDRKEMYLYIDLKAKKSPVKVGRAPLNISVVLDRSGSMAGDKIKYAREACKFVVDNLEANDYFSLVIYDDNVEVLAKSGNVKDKVALKKLIDGVHDRGSTNLSGGMLEGFCPGKIDIQQKLCKQGIAFIGWPRQTRA